MILFVYGTLLRGEKNHRQLQPAQRLRQASTAARYALLDLGAWPALALGGKQAVFGEIYRVDTALLLALDAFEESPEVYCRAPVALACATPAEAYFLQPHLAVDLPVLHPARWPVHAAVRGEGQG